MCNANSRRMRAGVSRNDHDSRSSVADVGTERTERSGASERIRRRQDMTTLLYGDTVIAGHEGYAPTSALTEQWKADRVAKLWRLGPRIISLQLDKALGGGIWKS